MPVSAPNILDFSVCEAGDCKSFNVSDTSGVYSASNSGGYGTPNFAISDAIGAYLVVTKPDATVNTLIVYPTLPDSAGTAIFTVTNTLLNITGSLPDGIYGLEYQVNFNNSNNQTVIKSTKKSVLLSCNIWCSIQKLIAKISAKNCSCYDSALEDALLAFGLYQSLIFNGRCGNTTNVTNILNTLTKLTSAQGCGCN